MNKKLILTALSAVMLSMVSYGQKVITDGNAVIIDCSGMDSRFYKTTKIEPRTTTATNSTSRTNGAADISSPESNAKVYKKFEVHKAVNNGGAGTDWKNAVTHCAGLNSNGTGWRLPTQRELQLIWVLYTELQLNGFSPFTAYCWSATEGLAGNSWAVLFVHGATYNDDKVCLYEVRCVRDL